MSEFELQFKSTADERYDAVLSDLCDLVFDVARVEVVETFGGTALTEDVNELTSDNGYVIKTDPTTARKLVGLLEAVLKRPVSLTERE